MCTGLRLTTKDTYFGRNLDYELSYGARVIITPRNYELKMKNTDDLKSHYAIMGMGAGVDSYPLYFDAFNEKGLGMGGLQFDGYAKYNHEIESDKLNLAEFEFVPYILGTCKTVDEAYDVVKDLNLTDTPFSGNLPVSPLHWMIADNEKSIVVESTEKGLDIYENPVDVLTNDPTFDIQLFNLNNYLKVSNKNPTNTFTKDYPLKDYSRGMGGIGLPGDYSSMSRFVKEVFVSQNSVVDDDSEVSSVNQFFHLLSAAAQPNGSTLVHENPNKYEHTIYTSCMNMDKGVFYYQTYDNLNINHVNFDSYDLEGSELSFVELKKGSFD